MGYIDSFIDQHKKWVKDAWEGIEDDPWRLLVGIDPVSTELSNLILNRDDEPLGGIVGGPTGTQMEALGYTDEERKAAEYGQAIAAALGMYFGGPAIMNAFGGEGGAGAAGGGEWDWYKLAGNMMGNMGNQYGQAGQQRPIGSLETRSRQGVLTTGKEDESKKKTDPVELMAIMAALSKNLDEYNPYSYPPLSSKPTARG